MKFKTFRILGAIAFVCLLLTGGAGMKYLWNHLPAPEAQPRNTTAPPLTAPAPSQAAQQQTVAAPDTDSIRARLDAWLAANPDRQGKTKLVDFLPDAPYRATAIRFPETDAVKWSDNPRQWSQVRLDLNRDGTDDEKWLLKNGATYKRETLDRTGKVTGTQYF